MTDDSDARGLNAHAEELIRATDYLVLGTVDADGHPWTSPVYFAPGLGGTFYWVSDRGSQHSVNLAAHPQVSLTVFDSTVLPYHGRALYARGEARELSGAALDGGLAAYPRPDGIGVTSVEAEEVTGDAPYRLYAVTATNAWVLCPREPRLPCPLHGISADHRVSVTLP